jgi:hypothetical protein
MPELVENGYKLECLTGERPHSIFAFGRLFGAEFIWQLRVDELNLQVL